MSSGCFLFLNLLLSFFWLCEEAQCVYLHLHLVQKSICVLFNCAVIFRHILCTHIGGKTCETHRVVEQFQVYSCWSLWHFSGFGGDFMLISWLGIPPPVGSITLQLKQILAQGWCLSIFPYFYCSSLFPSPPPDPV